MQIFYTMLLEAGKILAFVMVSFAFLMSALILVRPAWAQALNASFNRSFSTTSLASGMDIEFATTEKIIKHRFIFGILFIFGSVFILWSLMGSFSSGRIITYLAGSISHENHRWLATGLEIFARLMVFGAWAGLISGITLLIRPDWFSQFTQKMDQSFWADKETAIALDKSHDSIDSWVWRNHVSVGLVLLIGATGLLVVCIKMLIHGGWD